MREIARGLADTFGGTKNFSGPVIGSPRLNRIGLHPARIAAADLVAFARRKMASEAFETAQLTLRRDGVVAIANYLPEAHFQRVRQEISMLAQRAEAELKPPRLAKGFGKPRRFEGGFDRCDGATINRFWHLNLGATPAAQAFARQQRLHRLCATSAQDRLAVDSVFGYQLIHRRVEGYEDPQKDLHKDTFHSTTKFWLFLDPASLDEGPFEYVVGSHRMNRARYRWEYERSLEVVARTEGKGGAFRLSDEQREALGLPAPTPLPVDANTLVVADTRGFHRRGQGADDTRRLCIYGSTRRWPFVPLPARWH